MPGYSNVLGMHAFGLEEAGEYGQAEAQGRKAVELGPQDPWAIHAVTHVMEMQDRRRDGIDWVTGLEPHWTTCNNFRFHIWWHRCLMHLELEDYGSVLDLYDREVRAESTEEYLDITNATSMLWRLEERGVDVGARWGELAERSETRIDDHLLIFADAHFYLALAAAGSADAADRMLASMSDVPGGDHVTAARVARHVGLPAVPGHRILVCRRPWRRGRHIGAGARRPVGPRRQPCATRSLPPDPDIVGRAGRAVRYGPRAPERPYRFETGQCLDLETACPGARRPGR